MKPRVEQEAIPTSVFDTEAHDRELRANYNPKEVGDGFKPAFLYVERGPGAGQLVQLKQGNLVIGRASVADLRLQHPSISRRHAQLRRKGEQFFVKDLGSQNGTFVNKEKIEGEHEIKPGDSVAMGNALLKLRGPLSKSESAQSLREGVIDESLATDEVEPTRMKPAVAPKKAHQTAVVQRHRPAPPATALNPKPANNVVKIAIFAGAMGFGLAAVLAFALLKGGNEAKDARPAVAKRGSASKPSSAGSELEITVDDAKVTREKQIEDALNRKMAEAKAALPVKKEEPVAEREAAPGEERKPATVAKAATVATRSTAPSTARKAAAAAADDEFEDEDESPAPKGGKRAQILQAYEKGDAEKSLAEAKKAGDKDLISKLSQFIQAHDAAEDAVLSNNGGAAIKNFEKALKLDEQLSSGWGKYGANIRKQLGNLYTLVGIQFVKNEDEDKARIAFQAALKNDPANTRARDQLAAIGGAAKKPAAKAAADEEEEEEEEETPKKKPAAKKPAPKPAAKSRAQAIDDAFGD